MARDWKVLPKDLLKEIRDKFINVADYLKFAVVCKAWAKTSDMISITNPRCVRTPQFPLLMVVMDCEGNANDKIRQWLFLAQMKKSNPFILKAPDSKYQVCSSQGWLLVLPNDVTLPVCLYNPFHHSEDIILLPSLYKDADEGRDQHLQKCVLSAKPGMNSEYKIVVFAVHGKCMFSSLTSGQMCWKHHLIGDGIFQPPLGIADVCYYNGKFYFLTDGTWVFSYDLEKGNEQIFEFLPDPAQIKWAIEKITYLMDIHEELIIVTSVKEESATVGFTIQKFDGSQWIEVKSLGEMCLFLRNNYCVCSSADFPPSISNGIYFVGESLKDVGLFCLENGKIEKYTFKDSKGYPTALWVEPFLHLQQ